MYEEFITFGEIKAFIMYFLKRTVYICGTVSIWKESGMARTTSLHLHSKYVYQMFFLKISVKSPNISQNTFLSCLRKTSSRPVVHIHDIGLS